MCVEEEVVLRDIPSLSGAVLRDPLGISDEVYLLAMGDGVWSRAAKRMGVPLWGQCLIIALIALGAVAYYPVTSIFHRLTSAEGKLDKIQNAVTALASQSPLHELIKELLEEAKSASNSGDTARGQKAVEIANVMVNMLRAKKLDTSPSFFRDTVQAAKNLPANTEVTSLTTRLAEYRSSLTRARVPSGSGTQQVTVIPLGDRIGKILSAPVIRVARPSGADMFGPFGGECGAVIMSGLVLENGKQTLDCIHWEQTVFVNMSIVYRGGPVQLNGVYFVNCTFDFPPFFERTGQLAADIAIGLTSIRIG